MAIRNAGEASEVVKEFLARMGWSLYISPRRAERVDNRWIVQFTVGMREMQFEVDGDTGEILSYSTL